MTQAKRLWIGVAALGLCVVAARPARAADVPLAERFSWKRTSDFYVTGAALAVDTNGNNTIDTLDQPAQVTIPASDLPANPILLQAFLYWAGTVADDNDCGGSPHAGIDDDVDFQPPGAAAPVSVIAEVCHCSDGQNSTYDVQACRADVTSLITALAGDYVVDGFDALVFDTSSTVNASFALVLVYDAPGLLPRKTVIYDGVQTVWNSTIGFTLGNIEVDDPPTGNLTWYVLEGDVGGSTTLEQVTVGSPGNTPAVLSDAINPIGNPMNRTLNVTTPPQTGVLGVDIDTFSFGAPEVSPYATQVDVEYTAENDKWWIVLNIVGVNVFQAELSADSTKDWTLQDDADSSGQPSPGDTIRYTIHLENTGNGTATVSVTDPIPAQASSWALVSAAGGTDASTATDLVVNDIALAAGATADVIFDLVLAAVPDQMVMTNTAYWTAQPDNLSGQVSAPDVTLRRDTDGDGVPDGDDNCPNTPNPGQQDANGNGMGDACENCVVGDDDADGVCDDVDNCPEAYNPLQEDGDGDGIGDVCEICADGDADGDLVCNGVDNCPDTSNAGQEDADGDGVGDACDGCPGDVDTDGDEVCDADDNCPEAVNPGQEDTDGDGRGDACECVDEDGDTVCDAVDNCLGVANPDQEDTDLDGVGDACQNTGSGSSSGCGCRSTGGPASPWPLLALIALIALRRRRG